MEPASGPVRLLSVHAGHSTFFSASIDSLSVNESMYSDKWPVKIYIGCLLFSNAYAYNM